MDEESGDFVFIFNNKLLKDNDTLGDVGIIEDSVITMAFLVIPFLAIYHRTTMIQWILFLPDSKEKKRKISRIEVQHLVFN